jgi:hypothetical protein
MRRFESFALTVYIDFWRTSVQLLSAFTLFIPHGTQFAVQPLLGLICNSFLLYTFKNIKNRECKFFNAHVSERATHSHAGAVKVIITHTYRYTYNFGGKLSADRHRHIHGPGALPPRTEPQNASLGRPQSPETKSCPERAEFSPHPHTPVKRYFSKLRLCIWNYTLCSGFQIKIVCKGFHSFVHSKSTARRTYSNFATQTKVMAF